MKAISPIIFHSNAIVCGVTQGYLNVSNFRNNYKTDEEEMVSRDVFEQL